MCRILWPFRINDFQSNYSDVYRWCLNANRCWDFRDFNDHQNFKGFDFIYFRYSMFRFYLRILWPFRILDDSLRYNQIFRGSHRCSDFYLRILWLSEFQFTDFHIRCSDLLRFYYFQNFRSSRFSIKYRAFYESISIFSH